MTVCDVVRPSPSASTAMANYWLFKSEPDCYSIDDLKRDKNDVLGRRFETTRRGTCSETRSRSGTESCSITRSCDPMAIVGTAEVVKAGSPDLTAFDAKSDHPDPKSDRGQSDVVRGRHPVPRKVPEAGPSGRHLRARKASPRWSCCRGDRDCRYSRFRRRSGDPILRIAGIQGS